jgi:hypothetical protein
MVETLFHLYLWRFNLISFDDAWLARLHGSMDGMTR